MGYFFNFIRTNGVQYRHDYLPTFLLCSFWTFYVLLSTISLEFFTIILFPKEIQTIAFHIYLNPLMHLAIYLQFQQ
jgi:hypothetical protein